MNLSQISEFDLGFSNDEEITLSPSEWTYDDEDANLDIDFWNSVDTINNLELSAQENDDIVSMVSREIPENGQNHPEWIRFLEHFKSASVYRKRVDHFIQSLDRVLVTEELGQELINYFHIQHNMKKEDGSPQNTATVFRTWFSVFLNFFSLSRRSDLKQLIPSMYNDLTRWETGYEERHDSEFTEEQLIRYHEQAPNKTYELLYKCYASMATAFAARSADPSKLMRDQVSLFEASGTNSKQVMIEYNRSKQRGKKKRTDTHALVTGKIEVDAIERYMNCFKPLATKDEGSNRRFFCYLQENRGGVIAAKEHSPVGRNALQQIGKNIATFLELPHPERYTGQCWRATAATMLADKGFNEAQIMAVTGHSSSKALAVYVSNSKIQKENKENFYHVCT